MKKFGKKYNGWLKRLPKEQRDKLDFIYHVAFHKSFHRMWILVAQYNFKRMYALPKYKNYRAFANDELFKATEDLTHVDLRIEWKDISIELMDIGDAFMKEEQNKYTDFIQWNLYNQKEGYWLFLHIISSAGLTEEYLKMDVDYLHNDSRFYNIKNLRDFDKVIEFLSRFYWLIGITGVVKKQTYNTEIKESSSKLIFNQLFRPEYRDKIPSEVIRLLGPGKADAWELKDGAKKWIYKGPESAIMIPFYHLCGEGYIVIPSRKKKEFITVWLNEFGKDYKPKTFDNAPLDYEATEYFKEYLNKL
jgi:hypothetical protein